MTGSVVELAEVEASDTAPEVVIITGMSGAGRTLAAKVLEDLDFFVIDNLPPTLLSKVIELAFGPGSSVERLALVADVRGREFFESLDEAIVELRGSTVNTRVVFLEADDDTLVQRFEESRRRHPAAESGGVLEGIRREREQLRDLRGLADMLIDTSELNVHELRERIATTFARPDAASMQVKIVSFGYKYGLPRDSDLVMDVRFLPNPHWVDELRPHTGLDGPVRDYVLHQPETATFLDSFHSLLEVVLPGYASEGKRYLTIAIGCTGGRHRSVAIAEETGRFLRSLTDLPVGIHHRDLEAG